MNGWQSFQKATATSMCSGCWESSKLVIKRCRRVRSFFHDTAPESYRRSVLKLCRIGFDHKIHRRGWCGRDRVGRARSLHAPCECARVASIALAIVEWFCGIFARSYSSSCRWIPHARWSKNAMSNREEIPTPHVQAGRKDWWNQPVFQPCASPPAIPITAPQPLRRGVFDDKNHSWMPQWLTTVHNWFTVGFAVLFTRRSSLT